MGAVRWTFGWRAVGAAAGSGTTSFLFGRLEPPALLQHVMQHSHSLPSRSCKAFCAHRLPNLYIALNLCTQDINGTCSFSSALVCPSSALLLENGSCTVFVLASATEMFLQIALPFPHVRAHG